jgi:hypothetical protein
MATKPGVIGNGRKTILGEGALKSFAKECELKLLSVDKRKSLPFDTGLPGVGRQG